MVGYTRNIKCNFKHLRMEFQYNNKRMTLRGATIRATMHWMDGKSQCKEAGMSNGVALMMFCVYPNTGIQLLSIEYTLEETTLRPELQADVSKFDDVFALPTELPPPRAHDHRIPLLPNAPPVNIRPYRHPPMQKDAIEVMVK